MDRRNLLCVALTATLGAATALAQNGEAIYKAHCASCHNAATGRVPPFSALRQMDAATIMRAITTGTMKTQAAGLTTQQKYALVGYLAAPAQKPAAAPPSNAFCRMAAQPRQNAPHWGMWGENIQNTRFQSAKEAGLTAAAVPKLKLKWAFELGDGVTVHSQPAIAEGRVFVADLTKSVYALDAKSGCIRWRFQADAQVRSPIVAGKHAIYFGDMKANAYAVDLAGGKLLWKTHVGKHFAALLTGAPQLHKGVLYVPVSSFEEALPPSPKYECCTFRGSVVALDAATGKQIWRTYTIAKKPQPTRKNKAGTQMYGPSGAAVWSAPTFDKKRDVLYVATGDNYSEPVTKTSDAVLALDAKTGKILWSKQITIGDIFNNACGAPGSPNCPEQHGGDFDFGQPPILVTLPNGHRELVIGQKSGMVHALDPDHQGAILWQTRIGPGGALGGIQWGSAADRKNMYVAYSGLQIKVIPDKSAPHGYRLGLDPKKGGGLFALRLADGEKAWSAKPPDCGDRKHCSPAQSAAVSAIPGAVFSGSEDGHLRAYAAATGKVIWDVNTAHPYQTINGQKARGGSIDCAGPVIAGGILYVTSGYGQWGGMPGNVLLAFSVKGK
ncbi:MAG TPA: PQQ-binding-like beta-propeller repeat protein [Bryobacteraceae bacterium]